MSLFYAYGCKRCKDWRSNGRNAVGASLGWLQAGVTQRKIRTERKVPYRKAYAVHRIRRGAMLTCELHCTQQPHNIVRTKPNTVRKPIVRVKVSSTIRLSLSPTSREHFAEANE